MPSVIFNRGVGTFFSVCILLGIFGLSSQQNKGPEVKQSSGPRLVVAVGQDSVKLQCNVKNAVTYTWYKDGVEITQTYSERYGVRTNRFLEIKNVQKADSGLYDCVTSNKAGSANCSTRLLVEDPTVAPENVTGESPRFLYPEKMESVKKEHNEGDKFEITCEAGGSPTPVITWYKDGEVYTGRPGSRHTITPGKFDYKIKFSGIDIQDKGVFSCNVSNVHGWLTYNYTIVVNEIIRGIPNIYFKWEQKKPVYVEGNVEIYFMVLTQDPKTTYEWYYSDSNTFAPLQGSLGVLIDPRRYKQPQYKPERVKLPEVKFSLALTNLTINDSGLYGCLARNRNGYYSRQINLTVSYRPVIPTTKESPRFLYPEKMESVKKEHKEGDKFEITCEAGGSPTPVITWYKDGEVYTGRLGSGHTITPGKFDYKIKFSGIDIQDKGVFSCNVSNVHGWLTYNYTIVVNAREADDSTVASGTQLQRREGKVSSGAVAVIVFGVLAGLSITVVPAVLFMRYKKKHGQHKPVLIVDQDKYNL